MEKKILESRVNDVGKFEEKILARSITDVSNLKHQTCLKIEEKFLERSINDGTIGETWK